MTEAIRDKLEGEAGPVLWRDLRAHAKRGALLIAAAELDLLDAAVAIATDDAAGVEAWLGGGQLFKPDLATLESWDDDLDKPFRAVVVQPWALAKEAGRS
ncbi:MAG: DUF2288 family protein [Polyangiaceae bacterium]